MTAPTTGSGTRIDALYWELFLKTDQLVPSAQAGSAAIKPLAETAAKAESAIADLVEQVAQTPAGLQRMQEFIQKTEAPLDRMAAGMTEAGRAATDRLAYGMTQAAAQANALVQPLDRVAAGMSAAGAAAQDRLIYGMSQAGREAQALSGGFTKATEAGEAFGNGTHKVRAGLVALAVEGTGTNRAVGELVQGLLLFGAGSTVVLGVAAGVAVISGAFDLLTKRQREAQQASDDLAATLLQHAREASGELAAEQRAILQKRVSDASRAVENLAGYAPEAAENADVAAIVQRQRVQLQAQLDAAREALQQFDKEQKEAADKLAKPGLERTQQAKDAAAQFAQETNQQLSQLSGNVVDQTIATLEAFLAKYSKVVGDLSQDQRAKANAYIAELERQIAQLKALGANAGAVLDLTRNGASVEQEHALIDAANQGGGFISGTGSTGPKDAVDKTNDALAQQVALIAQAVRGASQLAEIFGAVGNNTAAAVQDAAQLVETTARLADAAKAAGGLGKLATGDIVSAVLSIGGAVAGLVGSILGGGKSQAEKDLEALQRQLVLSLQDLKKSFDSFAFQATGSQQVQARASIEQLLATGRQPRSGGGLFETDLTRLRAGQTVDGTTLSELQSLAKGFNLPFKFDTIDELTASLKALNDALKEADVQHYAEGYTGKLKAVNAALQLAGTTDPVARLKAILGVGTGADGSSALQQALGGLDVGNATDRAKLLDNLKDLLAKLDNNQLHASDLGGLTADQLQQAILDAGALIQQANQQGGQSQSFAVDRTITEVTGSRIAAVLDTQLLYLQTLPQIRDLLAGLFNGAIAPPPFPSLATAPGGLTVVIQSGAFPLTVVVPAGADGAAIGTAAAQAQIAALDRALAQRGALKSGSVLQ